LTRSLLCVCIAALSALLWTQPAAAQDAPAAPPRWTVQVDPLTFALGFAHVQLEYAFTDHLSVYVGPSLHLFNGLIAEPGDDYLGLGGELGVRYFFSPTAPRGWWVQARGVLAHLSSDVSGQEETALGGYVSALGGYTWIFDDRWVVAAGLGIQYIHYRISGQGPEGILPAAHTTIGFAF
jgi:hypothetical protein